MKEKLAAVFDERFLTHRLRSTSTAGIASAMVALLLLAWRFYADDQWSWDLAAIVGTFLITKWALMAWYRSTD